MTPTRSKRLGWELPAVDAKDKTPTVQRTVGVFFEPLKPSSEYLVGLLFFAGLSSQADLKRRFLIFL
jgi:hypothetical protein